MQVVSLLILLLILFLIVIFLLILLLSQESSIRVSMGHRAVQLNPQHKTQVGPEISNLAGNKRFMSPQL